MLEENICEQGMIEIASGNYVEGFDMIAKEFNCGNYSSEVFEQLYHVFVEPNISEFQLQYERNKVYLQNYPYLFCEQLNDFETIWSRYIVFPITESVFYYYSIENKSFTKMIVDSVVETEYFFENTENPVCLEDEYNQFNIQFLVDNLRDSILYGRDNHLYLLYSDLEKFSIVLYYVNLEKLCKDEKIVFLIGEHRKENYPLDSQYFKIDYETLEPAQIKLEEVKRLIAFVSVDSHCGNAMLDSLFDFHPNLLTIKEFGLSEFCTFYNHVLAGRTVHSFLEEFLQDQNNSNYRMFLTFFNKIYGNSNSILPEPQLFIDYLIEILKDRTIPTQQEWFVAFFIANSYALGRNMNSRMVPAIFHASHTVWGSDWEKEMGLLQEFYKTFPYIKTFSEIRRQSDRIGGAIKYEFKCRELYNLTSESPLSMIVRHCDDLRNIDWRRIYYDKDSFFEYDQMAVVKYEDIKMYPQETLKVLCKYLDIPWSDTLLGCSYNGGMTIYNDGGTVISDFDLAPLNANYYEKYLNVFDLLRLEILYTDFYRPWNYEPRFYNGFSYTIDEIKELMKISFEFEKYIKNNDHNYNKEKLIEQLEKLLLYFTEWKQEIESGLKIPCQYLAPEK